MMRTRFERVTENDQAIYAGFSKEQGYTLDFEKIDRQEWITCCIEPIKGDDTNKKAIFERIVSPMQERVVALSIKEQTKPFNRTPDREINRLVKNQYRCDDTVIITTRRLLQNEVHHKVASRQK